MKWAKSQNAEFTSYAYVTATKGGALETIKWLVEEGGWREEVILGAARQERWDVLLWAKEEGHLDPSVENSQFISPCAKNGSLEVLVWLYKEGYPITPEFMYKACSAGHVHLLNWMIAEIPELRAPSDIVRYTCYDQATKGGHVEVLKWCFETFGFANSACQKHLCAVAANSGQLETLKYLRNSGATWDSSTCAHAALSGNLKILKWARENHCPWDDNTCIYAAAGDFPEVLDWAIQKGCTWSSNEILRTATDNGSVSILNWAYGTNPTSSFREAEESRGLIGTWTPDASVEFELSVLQTLIFCSVNTRSLIWLLKKMALEHEAGPNLDSQFRKLEDFLTAQPEGLWKNIAAVFIVNFARGDFSWNMEELTRGEGIWEVDFPK
jgi:hypothetical protein